METRHTVHPEEPKTRQERPRPLDSQTYPPSTFPWRGERGDPGLLPMDSCIRGNDGRGHTNPFSSLPLSAKRNKLLLGF